MAAGSLLSSGFYAGKSSIVEFREEGNLVAVGGSLSLRCAETNQIAMLGLRDLVSGAVVPCDAKSAPREIRRCLCGNSRGSRRRARPSPETPP